MRKKVDVEVGRVPACFVATSVYASSSSASNTSAFPPRSAVSNLDLRWKSDYARAQSRQPIPSVSTPCVRGFHDANLSRIHVRRGGMVSNSFKHELALDSYGSGLGRGGGGGGGGSKWGRDGYERGESDDGGDDFEGGGELATISSSAFVLVKFHRALRHSPIATHALLTACVELVSELVSQISKPSHGHAPVLADVAQFDWRRLVAVTVLGGVMTGPAYVMWFGLLSKWCSNCVAGTIKKIVLDQLMFAFVFNYAYNAVMSKALLSDKAESNMCCVGEEVCGSGFVVEEKEKESLWDSSARETRKGWQYWPVVMFFTMTRVPKCLRPPMFKFAAFAWNLTCAFGSQGVLTADMMD
mmetsp:Transcript_9623/g.20297  ORF Transcript_9623/g.20297 Transcript_9623/m.20297 type:complete len:356 (+) Transcript_9623:133-1200(+)